MHVTSCSVPVGLATGIAISEFAGQLADAALVAMAAGTFIYVGATEVIAEEFEIPQDKWKKFFALTGEMFPAVCDSDPAQNSLCFSTPHGMSPRAWLGCSSP